MIKNVCIGLAALLVFTISACNEQVSEPVPEFTFEVKYSSNNDVEKISWPDDQLKFSFLTYWDSRFQQDLEQAWNMEAPHLRFTGSKNQYMHFHSRGAGQNLSEVIILKLDKVHEYKYNLVTELRFRRHGSEQNVNISNTWIKVNDNWYHLERNPLIFRD